MAEPRTVLITGAASGIGRALAHRYASEGARLLLVDLNDPTGTAAEVTGTAESTSTAAVDVREASATADAVTTLAAGQPIDVVVNCAGVLPPIDPVDAVSPDDFKRTIDINLTGSFNVVHAVVPHLRSGSHLALIASLGGLIAGYRYTAYSASKFGVVGLAETIRMELAQRGIQVHAICPGEVTTPMVDAEIAAGDSVQRAVKMMSGRPITAEQAADGIVTGIDSGSFFVIPSAQARVLSVITRVTPVPLRHRITDLSIRRAAKG
ncbi:MAG: SDR family NAD(P)-dependent oxidoreductase [Solirubrobacteraceae bacterium]|nr:SDR family NAD(P)-dependent oxidoreductase [Solirubrobacteraceae bacterium]